MNDTCERQRVEYEYVMEGITTRMQIAIEKIAESNKLLHNTVKYVCIFGLIVVFLAVSSLIVQAQLFIWHCEQSRPATVSEVVDTGGEAVSQFGQGT